MYILQITHGPIELIIKFHQTYDSHCYKFILLYARKNNFIYSFYHKLELFTSGCCRDCFLLYVALFAALELFQWAINLRLVESWKQRGAHLIVTLGTKRQCINNEAVETFRNIYYEYIILYSMNSACDYICQVHTHIHAHTRVCMCTHTLFNRFIN